jgi:rubrerythrin
LIFSFAGASAAKEKYHFFASSAPAVKITTSKLVSDFVG